ncbi:hypothetical protein GGR54DRAFT_648288 [Hypoxylon sp. NC1633]|nr:hypothetical protein GGR54DRAFT_648288 [Hypoxylon sp. NC1633]
MRVISYCLFLALFWLRAGHLVLAQSPYTGKDKGFTIDKCPWYYLRQNFNEGNLTLELFATCLVDDKHYQTSSLDLDHCYANHDEAIVPSIIQPGETWSPGPFSKTCTDCALAMVGGGSDKDYGVELRCSCAQGFGNHVYVPVATHLDEVIFIENGILNCLNFEGSKIDYSPGFWPRLAVPPTNATVTSTITTTISETMISNVTTTTTPVITVTQNVTVTSENTDTSTSTTSSTTTTSSSFSCPLATNVTVTKHKTTTKTKKVTTTVPATLPVQVTAPPPTPTPPPTATVPTTVYVTLTPSHSADISVDLIPVLSRSFTTIQPSP